MAHSTRTLEEVFMEVKEKLSIEETKKLFISLAEIAKAAKKIKEDGLKPESLLHLIDLAKKYESIIDGLNDLEVVLEEAKDLDSSEILELVSTVIE